MMSDTAWQRFTYPCFSWGPCKLCTRVQITSVLYCNRQILCYQADGLKCKQVWSRLINICDITFHRMTEGINSGIGRHLRRHTQHKLGIYYWHNWKSIVTAPTYLFICVTFGNNCPWIRFSTGPRSCWNCDKRQSLIFRHLLTSSPRLHIVPVITLISCHHRNTLCSVNTASAAKTDNKITSVFPCTCCALCNIFRNWICKDFIKNNWRNIVLL